MKLHSLTKLLSLWSFPTIIARKSPLSLKGLIPSVTSYNTKFERLNLDVYPPFSNKNK